MPRTNHKIAAVTTRGSTTVVSTMKTQKPFHPQPLLDVGFLVSTTCVPMSRQSPDTPSIGTLQ